VALDSVYGAYLKAKYPLEYYSVVLDIYENDATITGKLMKELKQLAIEVVPIQFGKSRAHYTAEHDTNSIYKGMASIKYINEKVSEELYLLSKEREYDKNNFVSLLKDIYDLSIDTRQMTILIRLGFFKEFSNIEELLEIFLCMFDKKKANTELYPDFADKIQITEKTKRTGEKVKEIKTIKRPLKYDSKHAEKTKTQRLENLYEYERQVRLNPPEKIQLYEQIAYEKEILGYAYSTWEHLSGKICLVMDIRKKYTPVITLYQVKTGREFTVKVPKKKFFKYDEELLFIGDVIKVTEVELKDGWKKVGEEWEKNPNKKEIHLNRCKLLRKSPSRIA
jgi:DNA polymerase III subunit alpha